MRSISQRVSFVKPFFKKNIKKLFSLSTKYKSSNVAAFTPHFVFSVTCAAIKHLISEKPLNSAVFQGCWGGVITGIECSPKIIDFRANGILGLESVDFSTLSICILWF